MNRLFLTVASFIAAISLAFGADPMATKYSFANCQGSLIPYPVDINPAVTPDSLTPIFINHVGRHGSRYPASSASCMKLKRALATADSLGTITPLGRKLDKLNNRVIELSANRWGALDSLGMAEQRSIASRMFNNFREVLGGEASVTAISSYSPRSMMSMFSFVHQLDRMNNKLSFVTSTGRSNSKLMRPFDIDNDYLEFKEDGEWHDAYDTYFQGFCPITAITRALGRDFPFGDSDNARDLAITEYYVIAGLSAMEVNISLSEYFTNDEINALWSCFNLRQYLQRTATTLSSVPADIASPLVLNIISTFDDVVDGNSSAGACLRFGHAETLMPLLSLLKINGCYYKTNYFDTVAQHWRDFEVVPMAANVQIILFKAKRSGRYYVRFDLNEKPVPLIEGSKTIYTPWKSARQYMLSQVPLYAQ